MTQGSGRTFSTFSRSNLMTCTPGLSRGRRGHTMTTVEGKLAVMGGAAKINGGDTEYLDDVEIFDGRRWKRANYKLDQPRDGANIVKIPITTFSYSFGK